MPAATGVLSALAEQSPDPAPQQPGTPSPATTTLPPVFPDVRPWPPAPAPRVPIGAFDLAHTLIPFASDRPAGGLGGFNLYIYDLTAQTVLLPPGANTPGDEFNPSLSQSNRWLVYATNGPGHYEVWLYDLASQLVNPLPNLNTGPDQESPVIDGSGTRITYQSFLGGRYRLRLFELRTQTQFSVAAIDALGTPILSPYISADGTKLAFATSIADHQRDIFLYDIPSATLWSPPFVNTPFVEDEPVLSPDNRLLVFSTTRRGNEDVMLADLRSGFVDPLVLANSPATELTPSFVGPKANGVLFVTDRTGKQDRRMMIFWLDKNALDTLPNAHEPGYLDTFSPP
ncbi:MAG TPA: hypothetical protein V6D47_05880 [Oscillatoriaceae cyanobacterium]